MEIDKILLGGRIFYFDLIKCIGILLVIFYHVQQYGFDIWDSVAVDVIYTFNMPLFFFVSGYLAFKSRKNIGYYFSNSWKKASLLLIPSLVFSLFWALVRKEEVDLSSGFGIYWFGVALFECFVIYYIISILTKSDKQQLGIMFLLSIVGVGYLSTGVGDKYLAVIELNHVAKYFHFFTLGMFAKYFSFFYVKILNSDILRTCGIGLFFVLFFLLRHEGLFPIIIERFSNEFILRYLGLFVTLMLLYDVSEKVKQHGIMARIVRVVAENSFGIYLLQYFFLPDFRKQEWVTNIDAFSMFIICVFYTIICVIVCLGVIGLLSRSSLYNRYVLGKR